MSVFPRGRRTSLRLDSFVDLTDVPCTGITKTAVTFAGELDEDETEAVWLRIESTDDIDQAKRAELRAKRDAVSAGPSLENVAALVVANANYGLGDLT